MRRTRRFATRATSTYVCIADVVAQDLEAAKRAYAPDALWSAESMALFTQAVVQGAFILAKAHDDPAVAADCIVHLRRYLESQLPQLPHD